ncbi:MAG TPA: substrate-binding domain-containing protein [Ktedonobacteraceae bacterium]|nr:substrate-binding domain-containing protein [Ktedonobacteraceae bacterium]
MLTLAAFFASVFNPGDPQWSFWSNVLTIAFAVIGPPTVVSFIANLLSKPRKQLSYQTESDAALVDQLKDLGEDMTVTLKGGALRQPTQVDNARLIMYKIINTGLDVIRVEDFSYGGEKKLRFEFAEAKLILCAVHHTEPDKFVPADNPQDIIHVDPLTRPSTSVASSKSPIIVPRSSASKPTQSTGALTLHKHVDLDGCTFDKGDAIVFKFVTQGRVEMKIRGELLGGKIVPYAPAKPVFTVPRVLLGLLLAFVIVLGINRFGAFQQNDCAVSFTPVSISGSTAFYDTVRAQASTYHQGCPFAMLNVQSSDSGAGLAQLEQNHLDIADAELSPQEAGYHYNDLQEHQVAVIVFSIIINKKITGINSLSQDDITKIYRGQYTNWKQLKGPDLPIVRYGRPSGSGTQAAFTRYVLQKPESAAQTTVSSTQEVIDGVSSNPGAIGYVDLGSADQAGNIVSAININGVAPTPGLVKSDRYAFWAIERMYTRQGSNNPLALSFITYTTNNIHTGDTFINITDMPLSVRAQHE